MSVGAAVLAVVVSGVIYRLWRTAEAGQFAAHVQLLVANAYIEVQNDPGLAILLAGAAARESASMPVRTLERDEQARDEEAMRRPMRRRQMRRRSMRSEWRWPGTCRTSNRRFPSLSRGITSRVPIKH